MTVSVVRQIKSFMLKGDVDWRDVPLFTALSLGVASVEAYVWLVNGTLFVCVI